MGKRIPKPPAEMGRPPIPIKWDEFDKLARMQCTEEEIAAWFDCSVDTIARACQAKHGTTFAEYLAAKKRLGRISLRRLQLKRAEAGSDSMLIWLGKNVLGQRDRFPEEEERDRPPPMVNITFGRAKKPVQAESK